MSTDPQHKRLIEDLSAYIDAELSRADKERLDAHLSGCADCRDRLRELRETSALLKRHLPREAPAGLAARALARGRAERSAPPNLWARPAFGFGLAAVGFFLYIAGGRIAERGSLITGAASSLDARGGPLPTGPALKTVAVPEPKAPPQPASPLPPEMGEVFDGARAQPPKGALRQAARGSGGGGGSGAAGAPAGGTTAIIADAAPSAPASDFERSEEIPGVAFAGKTPMSLKSEARKDSGRAAAKKEAAFPQVMMPLPLRDKAALAPAAALSASGRPAAQELDLLGTGMPLEEARERRDADEKMKGAENTVAAADRLEWSGTAVRGPAEDERVVIRDMQGWMNFWPLHSADPVPLIDFQKYMVVGIVAGPGSGWARIQAIEPAGESLVVRLAPRSAGDKAPAHTFHLKAIPQSDKSVDFQQSP